MAVRKSKLETEKMTKENIERVIEMLNPTDPNTKAWTKKESCEFLGMSYNTTRLNSIIEDYKTKKVHEEQRRAENRGKPATANEVQFCLKSYVLENETVTSIAESLFRPTRFVTNILMNHGVTIRPTSHDYFNPVLVAEDSIRETFNIGEVAYNTRYNTNCIIRAEYDHPVHGKVYKVWLLGDQSQFAFTAAYDLASLSFLDEVVNG